MSILTYIFGWPLLAALALMFVPRNYRVIIRAIAVLGHAHLGGAGGENVLPVRRAPVDADGYRSSSKFRGSNRSASAITSAWTA